MEFCPRCTELKSSSMVLTRWAWDFSVLGSLSEGPDISSQGLTEKNFLCLCVEKQQLVRTNCRFALAISCSLSIYYDLVSLEERGQNVAQATSTYYCRTAVISLQACRDPLRSFDFLMSSAVTGPWRTGTENAYCVVFKTELQPPQILPQSSTFLSTAAEMGQLSRRNYCYELY